MEGMSHFPDKYFELAIVDPPYGLGKKLTRGGGNHLKFKNFKEIEKWDVVPEEIYFQELKRISVNQIIWGGNYFKLGTTRGFIIWDKLQSVPNFSACEYAWTSFDRPSTMFSYRQAGCFGEKKIHPTQKPVDLYKWLLNNYAQPGHKILDTHGGSFSSVIACLEMGFDYIAFEIDEEYYQNGLKRIDTYLRQPKIFAHEFKKPEQLNLL